MYVGKDEINRARVVLALCSRALRCTLGDEMNTEASGMETLNRDRTRR